MAYSPVEQGRPIAHPGFADLARKRDATPAQLALAWLLARDGILPIPETGSVTHVREHRAALDLALPEDEMRHLDALSPPPRGPEPLAML